MFTVHLKNKLSKISSGGIIYDKAYNTSFHQNLEKIQYNSARAITRAILEKLPKKNFTKSSDSNLSRNDDDIQKLCYFYKIFNKKSPTHILNVIPVSSSSYFTRYVEIISSFNVRHDFFKNSFFPSTVIEWNKIDKNQKIRKF